MVKTCLPVSHIFENDSEQLQQLIDMVDVLELKFTKEYSLPEEKEKIFHLSKGVIEHDFISFIEENRLFAYFEKNNINHFSFDLGPACEYSKSILPLSQTLTKDEIFKIAEKRISFIRRRFKGTLSVENLNYYRTGLFEHIVEPAFITKFIDTFNLKFLFDLAHAQITAHNLRNDLYGYLGALPLDKVVEIHISRPFVNAFLSIDAHELPSGKDYELLELLISEIDSNLYVYIAIEYYKDIEYLVNGYRELQKRLSVRL